MPGHYVFDLKVLIDVFSLFDAAGKRYHALGIICSGTTFHVVAILGGLRFRCSEVGCHLGGLHACLDELGRHAEHHLR